MNSMDINEIRKKKNILRSEIDIFLAGKLNDFREETGLSINGISVHFEEVTAYGDVVRQYLLRNVNLEVAYE